MNSTANAVWADWKCRESYRAAVARIDVRFYSVREALTAINLSPGVAQLVLQWQQRTERTRYVDGPEDSDGSR